MAKKEAEYLAEYLKETPWLNIETLAGAQNTENNPLELTKKRGENIEDLLIKLGTDKKRLTTSPKILTSYYLVKWAEPFFNYLNEITPEYISHLTTIGDVKLATKLNQYTRVELTL